MEISYSPKPKVTFLRLLVKEQSEKADIKLNIQNTKIKASGPITSWQIDGEKWKEGQILIS